MPALRSLGGAASWPSSAGRMDEQGAVAWLLTLGATTKSRGANLERLLGKEAHHLKDLEKHEQEKDKDAPNEILGCRLN